MQGYIININKVKDEDLIVTILCNDKVYTTYRFYGARHSNINIGYKIDFELETNIKSTIPRLKDVLHLGFSWILDYHKMYQWQNFLKLFYNHLKDVDEIDSFYFDMLEQLVIKISKQNIKRAIIESYISLCEHEGRLHQDFICLLCEDNITDNISLIRGFIPTHPHCSYSFNFKLHEIKKLFDDKTTINLNDTQIEYLWSVLLQGL